MCLDLVNYLSLFFGGQVPTEAEVVSKKIWCCCRVPGSGVMGTGHMQPSPLRSPPSAEKKAGSNKMPKRCCMCGINTSRMTRNE